ncbi:hypothetical protein OPW19_13480 [Vibrio europaeus]|uniref:hypothetical protein n=1 Tax=Vibrio europaeus TaxID=300876 RepID=UPI00233F1C65|nr:hypothetical protein [Vibrio europaeus]MDC5820829.1 hypothetical protein [Vibrio europaeus]
MRNRAYYRIDELSDVAQITLGDLKHAVENEGLSLHAWIKAENLGYVHFWTKKGVGQSVVLRGHFTYKGLIKLSAENSFDLLVREEKSRVKYFLIEEPWRCSNFRKPYIALEEYSRSDFEFVQDNYLLPEEPFYACGEVQVGKDLFGALKRATKKPAGTFSDFFENVNADDKQSVHIVQMVLEPQNLRFKLDELTEHFGLDIGLVNGLETDHLRLTNRLTSGLLTEEKQLPNLKGSEERIVTNPIEQIMVRILKDKGKDLSSDQVWRCLRVDVKNEDERIYDTDFVIECMDQNEIVRRSLDGESTVSTGRRRFRNLLVEVKKNFKLY